MCPFLYSLKNEVAVTAEPQQKVLPDMSSSVVTIPGDRLCMHTFLIPPIFSSACRHHVYFKQAKTLVCLQMPLASKECL